ncbi:uroporphyrinogen-III C-methyltransferase [Leptospira ilyithenensis]|uniref:uroporphyrinogen-III C-methyltransferase n=1 Tax=Leptospira ilyithenensis TaxID=2484901 RepID=A0A4R9LUZ4_9LEPT|nr:uroporphyrinogen-III C-methyltransferase [Leptospira ilyithenensis]TGN11656.1 uroporphyrinogen-III C-methyltransferase [Leptospira ilyithenensis]
MNTKTKTEVFAKSGRGFVSFVGGGPGSVDLLTIRGLDRIQKAEVILYDALLDPSYLEIFPNHAVCLYVGKRSGQHSRTQEEINSLLIEYALSDKRIVRLKGGDPSIFGRLAEELEALKKNKIPFEIIPGISSVTAGAAALETSLTLRGVSRQVIILDGHTILEDDKSWAGMENFQGTIAILMGAGKIKELAEKLIDKGISPNTPMALIENLSGKHETFSVTILADARTNGIQKITTGPGILYIGEAIRNLLNQKNQEQVTVVIR